MNRILDYILSKGKVQVCMVKLSSVSPSVAGSNLEDLDGLASHICTEFPGSSDADVLRAASKFPDAQRAIIYPPTITRFIEGLINGPSRPAPLPIAKEEEPEEVIQQKVDRRMARIPDEAFENEAKRTGQTIEEVRSALRQKIEIGLHLDR